MSKHILVISQYFYPEQFRINDMCEEWVKRGHKVTVVTGIPNYPQGKYFNGYNLIQKRREYYKGIEIIRLPLIPRGSNSIMLVLNYLSFVVSGYIWKSLTAIKAGCVFIFEVSPMTQALPGVWYAQKRKIPCYLYVTDLWPENVEIVAGVKNALILKNIGKMVDFVYQRCTKIFVSSKSFIEAIHNRNVPHEKIQYWPYYAEEFYRKIDRQRVTIPEIPLDGVFNIIFAGNIGVAQGLDILPETALHLKQCNIKVRFNIVGDGRYKESLVNAVHKYDVDDLFNFIGKQPAKSIPEFIAVCDAALICLSSNPILSMTIPSKTQSCLACSIPLIVSGSGAIKKLIEESEAGLCTESGNAKQLAENICQIASLSIEELAKMGENGYRYYKKNFDRTHLLDLIESEMLT